MFSKLEGLTLDLKDPTFVFEHHALSSNAITGIAYNMNYCDIIIKFN